MARYRTVYRLTYVDAAYIAGIVDGEGTITLTATHRDENRRLVIARTRDEARHMTKSLHVVTSW